MFISIFGVSVAMAQPPSADDVAQELLRQQQRERLLRQQQELEPDVRLAPPGSSEPARLPQTETPCFRINRLTLIGEAADRFQWALRAANPSDDPALGHCLGAEGINLTLTRVQNAIIERGYITTRVLAAPQDLATGVLELTLIPGRIAAIRFTDDSDSRATAFNAVPSSTGDLLNLRDIEQALENFKRVPTADAGIQIAPAESSNAKPGESDLLIAWQQQRPLRLSLSLDDSGSAYTGKYQGSATVSYDAPFALNDLFYASVSHDLGVDSGGKGTLGHTLHYELPYGAWLLGFTAGRYTYHQSVVGAFQTYRYGGASNNSDIQLSRLLYRDAVRKFGTYARGWRRASSNAIDDTEVQVQKRRMAVWEAGFTYRQFFAAATLDADVAYRRGTGAFATLVAPEEEFGEGTSRPELFTSDLQLTVPITLGSRQWHYTSSWRGQWNRTPLVPQDRFYIGSRYTVRGFDGENALLGDRGWLLRNELGVSLGTSAQQLYAGIDYGRVSGPSTRLLVGRHLTGSVLGLRGGYQRLSWDAFVGMPLAKPEGFDASRVTAGFGMYWSL
jgi:hemolysin activation/secretion protein